MLCGCWCKHLETRQAQNADSDNINSNVLSPMACVRKNTAPKIVNASRIPPKPRHTPAHKGQLTNPMRRLAESWDVFDNAFYETSDSLSISSIHFGCFFVGKRNLFQMLVNCFLLLWVLVQYCRPSQDAFWLVPGMNYAKHEIHTLIHSFESASLS